MLSGIASLGAGRAGALLSASPETCEKFTFPLTRTALPGGEKTCHYQCAGGVLCMVMRFLSIVM